MVSKPSPLGVTMKAVVLALKLTLQEPVIGPVVYTLPDQEPAGQVPPTVDDKL